MYILWCQIGFMVAYLGYVAASFAYIMLALHKSITALNPFNAFIKPFSPCLRHYSAVLPIAVKATNKLSIVRFSFSVSWPCGSYHSCNINFAAVWANGCTGYVSQSCPVLTSRYEGIASNKGNIITSLSVPSTLNASLASSMVINNLITPFYSKGYQLIYFNW